MAVTTTKTNKPLNPRGNDQSPKGYNRAELYSGKALDFDGVNDNVAIHDATAIWTGDFSVSWYANNDTTGNFFAFSSGTYTGTGQAGINFWYGGGSNKSFSAHFPETDGTGQQGYNLTLAESYTDWHRLDLVFVSSSRLLSLYQNGILIDSATIASNVDAAYMPNGWEFGRSYGGSFPLNGKLTNLKAFNVALTAAQVADLYNNPEKIVPTGVADSALKLYLPMQEGAGTTAYDGSGNGNHGTISGATWTHGIGAPVAQTAVIDWNKGTNYIQQSEALQTTSWGKVNVSVTANSAIAPNGLLAADKVVGNNGSTTIVLTSNVLSTGTYTFSAFFKAAEFSKVSIRESQSIGQYASFDLSNGTILDSLSYTNGTISNVAITNYGDGWYRCSGTYAQNGGSLNLGIIPLPDSYTSGQPLGSYTGDGVSGVYAWGAQAEVGSTLGAYVRSNADGTAQTSDVLLPQGLTTGRDITGVNLFENVRKQGALNLDGNSWAGVHDNASHDLSTAVTFEFWCKVPQIETFYTPQFIGKRDQYDSNWLRMYKRSNGDMVLEGNGGLNLTTSTPDNTWTHFVATLDGTSAIIYKNGTSAATGSLSWTMVDKAPIGIGGWLYALDSVANANSLANGQIAQPRIYNRALTAEEIERNYSAGKNTYKN